MVVACCWWISTLPVSEGAARLRQQVVGLLSAQSNQAFFEYIPAHRSLAPNG
jgi:hypothetical protein